MRTSFFAICVGLALMLGFAAPASADEGGGA